MYTEIDIEQIELYVLDMLSAEDKLKMQARIAADDNLQKLESEHRAFLRLIERKTKNDIIRTKLDTIRREQPSQLKQISENLKLHINKYWKTASVAASVAIVASTLTFLGARESYNKKLNRDLQLLSRGIKKDIQRIEKKTNAMDKKINAKIPVQPKGSGKQSGTAFALNNDGYVLTNQHVIAGGGDIYVFTPDNIGHKCAVIASDANLDVAVLKIDEKDFKFGKNVPYNFSNSGSMAQKVYTLGFPKNSIVYNEGYISSTTGIDDDSNKFQLELPSSPGVSGSPVFNEKGNIVALVNSKESISGATTFALKGKEISNFIKSIDSLSLPKGSLTSNTRTNQIKELQDFVFVVKLY